MGQILRKRQFPVKSLMQHISVLKENGRFCVAFDILAVQHAFVQFAENFVVIKEKQSYDTFNSATECVYGRDQKCKEERFPRCFEGKIFHLSRA